MSVTEEIGHDCTTLFQFVSKIVALCDKEVGPQRYEPASQEFLDYLRALGEATLTYLERFAESITTTDAVALFAHRQRLYNLRSQWNVLHSFVKPTKEADTLSAPASLISALANRVSFVAGFNDARFAVFHTDKLNYLHLNKNAIRSRAEAITSLISSGPAFPSNLGLIGIPYSQAGSCHLNSLLAHEMGHYVFQERTNRGELVNLENSLKTATETALKPILSSIKPHDVEWCRNRLVSWVQELYCDLFAVGMVGPTYTFAYLELFDLSLILDPSGSPLARASLFNTTHPADVFRLREQTRVLQNLGWWDLVEKTKSHYLRALEIARSVKDESLLPPASSDLGKRTLHALLEITPAIHEAIGKTLLGVDPGTTDFREFEGPIREHLVRGIVPSTVVVGGKRKYPGSVALLNAAHKMCLESLDELIAGIDDQDKTSARVRAVWYERVELWILKALEDNHLLTREKGSSRYGVVEEKHPR